MNRQEAIRALVLAGKTEAVEQLIAKKVAEARTRYDDVRADDTRTEEYRRRELAQNFEAFNDGLTDELVKMAGTSVRTDRVDAGGVFGVDGLPGDEASLVISRRDAGDRVAGITDPEELRDLLARATRQGDEVLARAVAERAFENHDSKTLSKFVEARPHLEDAAVRLWDARLREDRAVDVGWQASIMLSELRPEELNGMSIDVIRSLASDDAPTRVDLDDPSGRVSWD